MRSAPLLFSLLALAPALAASTEEDAAPAQRQVLERTDCLRPSAARSWDYIADDELVVDAGRRKYHIRLADQCPEMGQTPVLAFEGYPTNRICGNFGETVRAERKKCRIASVELIDAQTYRDLAHGKPDPTPEPASD